MKGIFVNEDGGVPYARAIVSGVKTIETRKRDMLRACVGERIAVVRTRRNRVPTIIGYVTITHGLRMSAEWLDENRNRTLIPVGSKYDTNKYPKYAYFLENAELCEPYPLPADAVRHGRSWVEF